MDDFLLISFKLKRELDNIVQNSIYNFDITGFEVDDPVEKKELLTQTPEWELSDIEIKDDGYIKYKVFFVDDEKGEKAMNEVIIFLKSIDPNFNYEFEYIDNSNWEDEWKKTYTSFPIGDKVWIKPSWEQDATSDKIVIEIDPKMAFGTGTHETTSLCIEYAQNLNLQSKKILDIGCGSGILSILASKMGASQVDACDIDELAIENAIDNIKINKVKDVNVFYSDLFSQVDGKYDVIFANILAEILLEMIDKSFDYLNDRGMLILSGIILEKKDLVKNRLIEKGYTIKNEIEKGEWALLVALKENV